jgi:hypothetical protein
MYFDAVAQLTVFPLPTVPFLPRVFDGRSSLSTMRLVSRQLQNCDSSNNVQGALLLADTHPEAEFPALQKRSNISIDAYRFCEVKKVNCHSMTAERPVQKYPWKPRLTLCSS